MGSRRKQIRSAKDITSIEDNAMPMYLQEAASVLEAKLAEFTISSKAPSDSLKRILDRASQLFPLPKKDEATTSETGSSICRHNCRYHEELMDPALWGTLPSKLLFHIFARLPLAKIMSVKSLSHQWNSEFNEGAEESGFLQVCDVNPAIALLTRAEENKFRVRLLDVKLETWHTFQIKAGHAHAVEIGVASADGGLVCFISSLKKSKTRTFLVDVVNPLTQHACALPPLQDFNVVYMVQMVANPKTKLYKVLVVGEGITGGTTVTKLYDLSISLEKWTSPKKQKWFVHGYGFHWGNLRYNQRRDSPCVYDFSTNKMHFFKGGTNSQLDSPSVKSFALLGDRLFLLKKDRDDPKPPLDYYYNNSTMYYIVEFRLEHGTAWCKIRSHHCIPVSRPPKAKYNLSLFACNGFLMVLARLPEVDPYRNQVGWIYNLYSRRWCDLPNLPGEIYYNPDDMMCRLHWNASV